MQVGIDIEDNNRFVDYVDNADKLNKIFTIREIEYFFKYSSRLDHITGNFCAKEAVAKALKTGFGGAINLKDIEILHTKDKVPYVNVDNQKLQNLLQNKTIDISISHTDNISTAICVIS